MMEYNVESPTFYNEKRPTFNALLKRELIKIQNNRLIVTNLGLSIIPVERITYPIYKNTDKSEPKWLESVSFYEWMTRKPANLSNFGYGISKKAQS